MASNEDRYGYGHRQDPAHDVGDSAPGTVGDSQGTFHDRAYKDGNVIVDGEVMTQENYKRKSQQSKSDSKSVKKGKQGRSMSTSTSKLDGKEVTVTVDRISGSGNAIANYKGQHVHVEDGKKGAEYRVELKAKTGYLVGKSVPNN